ncbi:MULTISPECIES: carbon-nitrogen hydrolase family protein [unclassified Duganella]|uniref:carbon-nitrogen hydrolase family protein n=1 Tax=unclassified Duganella TaxID=2636909 RepID=UPI001E5AFD4E|nr:MULTISPECIES: carbon-nitrogen hydrolase family protein [unclassified Duganella]
MGIRIAAAQSPSIAGDIEANVRIHLRFIEAAQAQGVELLLFPELSLCGYELPLLRDCLLTPDDARLAPLRDAAMATGMRIIAGAPLAGDSDALPYIAAFSFLPDGTATVYRKQYLHPGEELYARPGPMGAHCQELGGQRYAQAICADATHYQHAADAAAAGASIYLAGVLISETGYANDAAKLQRYANDFGMGVLMANHAAPSGGYAAAGRSAWWTAGGVLSAEVTGPGSALLVVDRAGNAHVVAPIGM